MEIKEGYKQTEVGIIPVDWEVKNLGETALFIASGKSDTKSKIGDYPIYGSTGIIGFNKKYDYQGKKILLARVGANAGAVNCVNNKYCVSDNTLIIELKKDYDFTFIFFFLNYFNLNKLVFGSGQPLITGGQLKHLFIPLPPTKAEQTAIATVLSDTDALISSLDKLVAKKRNIKKGAMQELLKPKKGWSVRKFGEIAEISKGEQLNRSGLKEDDLYPVMNGGIFPSGFTDKWNTNAETIIISEGGNSCGYVNFIKTAFWKGGHCYEVKTEIHKLFLFQLLKFNEKKIMNLRVGSGLPNIQRNRLDSFDLTIPETKEQLSIAQILCDMDAEIDALERKRYKYKAIKQGMMQELLIGKTRLV